MCVYSQQSTSGMHAIHILCASCCTNTHIVLSFVHHVVYTNVLSAYHSHIPMHVWTLYHHIQFGTSTRPHDAARRNLHAPEERMMVAMEQDSFRTCFCSYLLACPATCKQRGHDNENSALLVMYIACGVCLHCVHVMLPRQHPPRPSYMFKMSSSVGVLSRPVHVACTVVNGQSSAALVRNMCSYCGSCAKLTTNNML